MSGVVQLGLNYATNEVKAISVNANGELEMTAEIDSSGLATSANQTNGTQKCRAMGGETDGTQQQLLTSNNGTLQTFDGEVWGKASQIANQTALSNTQEQTIIANQTNNTQSSKCMGNFGGAQVQIKVDTNGVVETSGGGGGGGGTQFAGGAALVATGTGTAMIGRDSGNVARLVATDANGHIEIVSSTGAGVALESAQTTGNASLATIAGDTTSLDGKVTACNTGAVVISSNSDTTKATSTLQSAGNAILTTIDTSCSSIQSNVATSALQGTANGHLSEIEGAVETLELCVSSNELVINNKNAKPSNLVKNSVVSASTNNITPILDTESYRSIIVIGKTDSTSASWNIEWSDSATFTGGTDIIYNTDSPGGLSAFTPLGFQGALSADSVLSYIQGISIISQIPQRYMRIRVSNTSGSNRDYTFFYQLSN